MRGNEGQGERLWVWSYQEDHQTSKEQASREEREQAVRRPQDGEIVWVHLTAPSKSEIQQVLGDVYGAHDLAVKIAGDGGGDRPRFMRFRDHVYLTFFVLDESNHPEEREVGVLIGEGYLVTLTEQPDEPVFAAFRQRLQDSSPRLLGSGHLLYLLLDTLVESYLSLVDRVVLEVQDLEQRVFLHPFENEISKDLFRWKRHLHRWRRVAEEEQNIVQLLAAPDLHWIADEETSFYLKDLDQSFGRAVGGYDSLREGMAAIFDLQMSLKSDHMNKIMKTLTLFSALFLPLTFLSGVYGTNFEYVPELKWRYSYFVMWGVMVTVALSLFTYFKKKRWF